MIITMTETATRGMNGNGNEARVLRQAVSKALGVTLGIVAGLLLSGLPAGPAQAETVAESKLVRFDIPAQPVATALLRFSEQAGIQVTMPGADTRAINTPGVQGSYQAGEALRLLLLGTGLQYRYVDATTVVVTAPASAGAAGDANDNLRVAAGSGQAAGPESARSESNGVEEIVVHAHRFLEGEISKSGIPLLENPQAISVVTADTIKMQGITDLNDAMRAVAGVSRSSTYGFYDAYTIRGYDTAYDSLYQDGLFTTGGAAGVNQELAGLERVEVLKGPASSLYGAVPLGGVVNLVSKRPKDDSFLDTSIATGSYDLFEAAIDANAPLSADGTWLGRLNVLYRDGDDFVANSGRNRIFVAPALTWSIRPQTHLTVLARWTRDRDNPWSPLPAEGTVLPNANGPIPRDFAVHFPGGQKGHIDLDSRQIGYVFDHAFNESVSISQSLRYSYQKGGYNNWVINRGFVDGNYVDGIQQGHVLGLRVYGPTSQVEKLFAVDTRLTWKFATGALRHQLLAATDYRRFDTDSDDRGTNYDASVNTLDYLQPDYGPVLIHDPIGGAESYTSDGHQTGFYVQDHIGIDAAERWFVTLGARWDKVYSGASFREPSRTDAFSPRAGLSYVIADGTSLYASWSRSFSPQFPWIRLFDGSSAPNGQGTNHEIGIKFSNGATLHGAAAVFELTRTNVPTGDPEHMDYYVITGEQRSRGFEVEGAWAPWSSLELSLAYTFLDAKVTEDNDIPVGTRLGNVPKHNLYLRGQYSVQQGPLSGLSASIGVQWNSDKVGDTSFFNDVDGDGDNDNGFVLPDYTLVDVGVAYEVGTLRFALNVNNLFDKEYFPEASDYNRVVMGLPRNWRFSVSQRF